MTRNDDLFIYLFGYYSQEYEAKTGKGAHSPSQLSQGRRKNLEFEPLSTTALILEDRPAWVPGLMDEWMDTG